MNVYRVQNSKWKFIVVLIGIFVLFGSCTKRLRESCGLIDNNPKSIVSPADGIYRTSVDGSEKILIWVDKGNVKGVFFDSISQSTRIKVPVIQFFVYDSVGREDAADYLNNYILRYSCQNTSVAINTENEDIRYYIAMCGKGRDCWYKR